MGVLVWSVLGWVAIIPIAIANGGLREFLLVPRFGIRVAQPISGVLLMGCIGVVVWFLVGRLGPRRGSVFLGIGMAWALATVAFEAAMIFGRGEGWDRMAAQYSFADINLWPIVLVWVTVAPLVMAKIRRRVLAGS